MENKNQIPIIASALFAIVILLAHGNIERAFAITIIDNAKSKPIGFIEHNVGVDVVFSTIGETDDVLTTYKASDGSVLYTNDLTSTAEKGDWTVTPNALECSGAKCWVLMDTVGTSPRDQIIEVVVNTGVKARAYNFTSNSAYLVEEFFNSQLWVMNLNAGADELIGLNTASIPYAQNSFIADVGLANDLKRMHGATISSVPYLSIHSFTSGSWFKIINLSNLTTKCTVAGAGNSLDADTYNSNWYVASATNIKVYNNSCVLQSTIADTNFCGATGLTQDVEIHSTSNQMFVACDITNTQNKVINWNLSSSTVIATYGCAGDSIWGDTNNVIGYSGSLDVIGCLNYTQDKIRLIYQGEPPEEPVENTCDTNPETVFCRLGGENDNSTSGLGSLVGNGIVNLGCNVAFVDCTTDSNPATNGLGLLIFIASIFVVIGMFYWGIGHDAFRLPLFIWVVIILALSAFFTITGIIDPIFLILSIIALIALASPKAIETLRGSTFGRGSSE
jgi:hypothetical protein